MRMFLFAWFKRFSRKSFKPQPIALTLAFTAIPRWLDVQEGVLLRQSPIENDLTRYVDSLKQRRWQIECMLDQWQQEGGQNDRAWAEQERQEASLFFVRIRAYLESFTFTDVSLTMIVSFNKAIALKTEFLLAECDSTVLSFLPETPEAVIFPLTELRESFEQKITRCGLRTVFTLREKYNLLQEVWLERQKVERSLLEKVERLRAAKEKWREKEEELMKYKHHPDYEKAAQLAERRTLLLRQKAKVEEAINAFFSRLNPAVEVYVKIEPQTILQKYVQDPLRLLVEDEGFMLKHALLHLTALVESGKLNLPLREELAVRQALQEMPPMMLEGLREDFLAVRQHLGDLSVTSSKTLVDKVEEIRYRQTHFKGQIHLLRKEFSNLRAEHANLVAKQARMLTLWQNIAKVALNKDITVSFGESVDNFVLKH